MTKMATAMMTMTEIKNDEDDNQAGIPRRQNSRLEIIIMDLGMGLVEQTTRRRQKMTEDDNEADDAADDGR